MLTMRQIEKWWNSKAFGRLMDELCAGRAEGVNGIRELLDGPVAAAAMTIIRADELRQSSHPHVAKMVRLLIDRQSPRGGWTDAVTTALAARGLALGATASPALDNALSHLADLQSEDGEWCANPASLQAGKHDHDQHNDELSDASDAFGLTDMAVTAFVLYQLATIRRPAAALLIDNALGRLLAPVKDDFRSNRQVDTQLNTLRRRIESRRVLAPAA